MNNDDNEKYTFHILLVRTFQNHLETPSIIEIPSPYVSLSPPHLHAVCPAPLNSPTYPLCWLNCSCGFTLARLSRDAGELANKSALTLIA